MKSTVRIVVVLLLAMIGFRGMSQSIELMPGNDRFFADVQFLKPLQPENYTFTVFSRTRATVTYENDPDLFSASYVNYSTKSGFGLSAIGAISTTTGFGYATGINFLKNTKNFSVFTLVAAEWEKEINLSWFTIAKYRPDLNEKWKLYSSVELFSLVSSQFDHLISVQRLRLGLERNKYQFGVAANLNHFGSDFDYGGNYGAFVRKEF